MSDNNTDEKKAVDLSELTNLQFSTAWTPSSSPSGSFGENRNFKSESGEKQDSKRHSQTREGGERKFGKPRQKFQDKKGGDKDGPQKFSRKFSRKFDKQKKPAFVPTMEVLFYPDDAPFNKLADLMKASKRTYQLFDIAQLVLEKPERFIVLAKNLPDSEGKIKPIFCAQPLNLPFEDEQHAKNAAIEYYLNELFTIEQIDAEPPKGNFQVVNKCSLTGDLLGAPNWHRYNEYLREYHRTHCANKTFDDFLSSIESVRDEEQINAWLEQMKKRNVYKLKSPAEGENDTFDTREAAANYISSKFGGELVKTYEQVRMRGANLSKLPYGRIRKNIEENMRKQRRFPIVTANNLRGRLRRSGFVVYKRGSNGFAFVSSVHRKFLFEGDKLSELPQKLFDFISANPGITAAELPYKFMGLEAPTAPKPKTLAEENKDGGAQEAVPAPGKTDELDEATKTALNSTLSELLWLISEGYVVEYADSTLQANPYLPRPKDKSQPAESDNLGAADEPLVKEKSPEVSTNAEVSGETENSGAAVGETPNIEADAPSDAGESSGKKSPEAESNTSSSAEAPCGGLSNGEEIAEGSNEVAVAENCGASEQVKQDAHAPEEQAEKPAQEETPKEPEK